MLYRTELKDNWTIYYILVSRDGGTQFSIFFSTVHRSEQYECVSGLYNDIFNTKWKNRQQTIKQSGATLGFTKKWNLAPFLN